MPVVSSHLRAGAKETPLPLHQPASRKRPDLEVLVAGGQELVGVEAEAQRQRFLDTQAGLAPVQGQRRARHRSFANDTTEVTQKSESHTEGI